MLSFISHQAMQNIATIIVTYRIVQHKSLALARVVKKAEQVALIHCSNKVINHIAKLAVSYKVKHTQGTQSPHKCPRGIKLQKNLYMSVYSGFIYPSKWKHMYSSVVVIHL